MSVFEFVYGFMSIVSSLAVAHLFSGFVQLMRNASRVRFSVPHALWAWGALTSTIGNWASSWSERTLTSWPAWCVLLTLSTSIGQYCLCDAGCAERGEDRSGLVPRTEARRLFVGIFAVAYNLAFGLTNHYADGWATRC